MELNSNPLNIQPLYCSSGMGQYHFEFKFSLIIYTHFTNKGYLLNIIIKIHLLHLLLTEK